MIVNTYMIKGYSYITVNQLNSSCFFAIFEQGFWFRGYVCWNSSEMSQTSIKMQLNWDLAEICLEGLMLICYKLV
jgi:hypothetical protein